MTFDEFTCTKTTLGGNFQLTSQTLVLNTQSIFHTFEYAKSFSFILADFYFPHVITIRKNKNIKIYLVHQRTTPYPQINLSSSGQSLAGISVNPLRQFCQYQNSANMVGRHFWQVDIFLLRDYLVRQVTWLYAPDNNLETHILNTFFRSSYKGWREFP